MRALVVYESMFGCTRDIASAVAGGLSPVMEVELVEVGVATHAVAEGTSLLVVGGPTHAFGMSRPRTREDSLRQPGHIAGSIDIGIREWLETLEPVPGGVAAAAFDTRVNHPRLPGSAAHGIDKRLRARGLKTIAPPESFWVTGMTGPLLPGETACAKAWGEGLGATLVAAGHSALARHRGR